MANYRPTRITAQSIERNVRAQRIQDAQRQQLHTFANENTKLLSAAHAQEKIEVRRRQAYQEMCRNEQSYEDRIREEQQRKRQHQRTLAQNNALATELDRSFSEDERKRKEIQRICEESPELRELERQLKIAYLNKERAVQQEEKMLLAAREQQRIHAMEEQMEYDRVRAIQEDVMKNEAKKIVYLKQREVLQKQIDERKALLVEAQREQELDRQMVERIVKQINSEDEEDMRKRREMQAATSTMIRNYEEQRRREVAEAKARERAEEERIAAYNRSVAARTEGVEAKKQAKRDEEDRILKQIVEETERKRRMEEEFNNLRDLLWEEELEAKRAAEVQRRVDKQREAKKEMMAANSEMLKAKVIARVREAEEEAKMVALMRRKFAEDEDRERMEALARKKATKDYMARIEHQRKEKKYMTDQERAQEIAEMDENNRREEYRQKVIREARKRLLEEHASRLEGYMPRGVIESEEEAEIVRRAAGRY
jgi:hypothetical protein